MDERATGVDPTATLRQIAWDALRKGAGPVGVLARGVIRLADDVARRDAKLAVVRNMPHEDWCCAKGCAGPGFCPGCAGTEADCRCFVSVVRATLDGDARCGDWPAPCNCDDPTTHTGRH